MQLIDWEAAYRYMDYINLMTYDYYGEWDTVLGHQTSLYPSPNSPRAGSSAHEAVQHLLSRKVPAGKISLGVAMYGRSWHNVSKVVGNNPFTGIGRKANSDSQAQSMGDYKTLEAHFQGGEKAKGTQGFSLLWDDRAKGNYVMQYKLAGVFAWELDGDNGHLLNAMNEGLGHQTR